MDLLRVPVTCKFLGQCQCLSCLFLDEFTAAAVTMSSVWQCTCRAEFCVYALQSRRKWAFCRRACCRMSASVDIMRLCTISALNCCTAASHSTRLTVYWRRYSSTRSIHVCGCVWPSAASWLTERYVILLSENYCCWLHSPVAQAINVAQNRPLWRLMSTFGATHS